MEIIAAKSAGFCYGVKLAVDTVYREADLGPVVCLGPVVHNKRVMNDLKDKGVDTLCDIEKAEGRKIIVRAHGVKKQIIEEMDRRGFAYTDCICKDVKAIQALVSKKSCEGFSIVIIGDKEHPEIQGVASYVKNPPVYIKSAEDALSFKPDINKKYAVVEQTTFPVDIFGKIKEIILADNKADIEIFDTICRATEKRQKEAEEIAKKVDIMIVLGDKQSSNANKLYDICREFCEKTYFIESINELELNIFGTNVKIGITAGASTPLVIIKEAVNRMSELNNDTIDNNEVSDPTFEEMLDESIVTLHTGDVVKGTVISVVNGEVSVNLGYKSDGLITRTEFSDDPDVNPAEAVKTGDEIEVFVVRVNDGDGNVLLSKKRLEIQKGFKEIEEAFNENTTVRGRITEVVKGGLICMVKGVRVFVPSSQIASRYVDDLNQFIGKEFNFSILEYDKGKRRIVAGRRELAVKEENAKKEELFSSIEEGQKLSGTVSRIVEFGAFVDLGGADGLIHVSELSWGRVKKVTDVLKQGDSVTVTVLKVDKEKEKISLSLRDVNDNPWNNAEVKYPVGAIVEGRVVRMVSFGAFVELEPGVDGLVHISQIAQKHVVKPEDELKTGEIISVKIVDVDMENKKISLSKKEADGILNPSEAEDEVYETMPEEEEEAAVEADETSSDTQSVVE